VVRHSWVSSNEKLNSKLSSLVSQGGKLNSELSRGGGGGEGQKNKQTYFNPSLFVGLETNSLYLEFVLEPGN
jgi:hypothetical protein